MSKYTSFEIAIAQPGVSELINIKINDIDNNRMVINIRHSKGNKDRQVQLTNQILDLLRKYYKKYLPVNYLIVGQNGGKYSTTSIQKIIKNSALKWDLMS